MFTLPNTQIPVSMDAEVLWSKNLKEDPEYKDMFYTGVKLISVGKKSVEKSIHFDKEYNVFWSEPLESVLGNFVLLSKSLKQPKKD